MVSYRRCLVLSLFFKAFLKISISIGLRENVSNLDEFSFVAPKSSQYFSINKNVKEKIVGVPISHVSSVVQVTGEATYCDDIKKIEDELYIAFVLSSVAKAESFRLNLEPALQFPGVVSCFSAADLKADRNRWGTMIRDEEVFLSSKVSCQGQVYI